MFKELDIFYILLGLSYLIFLDFYPSPTLSEEA